MKQREMSFSRLLASGNGERKKWGKMSQEGEQR